jgi:hypothetical protein
MKLRRIAFGSGVCHTRGFIGARLRDTACRGELDVGPLSDSATV